MSRTTTAQREWLLEDLEQIQRYFPGAELLETLDTPFDIKTQSKTVTKRMRSTGASEKRAGEWRLFSNKVMRTPQEGQAPLERMGVFFIGGLL